MTSNDVRRTSTIPFGYELGEDGKTLLPIQQELDAYTKAKQYLQTCSYREVASWLSATTKRPISAQGLRKKVLNLMFLMKQYQIQQTQLFLMG